MNLTTEKLEQIATNRKSICSGPIKLTVEEVKKIINFIPIKKPDSNNRYENTYFNWYAWRINCVRRAIFLFCLKLHEWGYETYFSNKYFSAKKGSEVLYCQYEDLLHNYSIPFAIYDNMEIVCDKESFDEIFQNNKQYRKIGFYDYSICDE